jgi:hypothetical protein
MLLPKITGLVYLTLGKVNRRVSISHIYGLGLALGGGGPMIPNDGDRGSLHLIQIRESPAMGMLDFM